MEIKGKIIAVLGQKSGTSKSGNAWKSQEYVIETDDQYPKKVCFSLWGDRIGQFNVQEGEDLTVSFDIDAKEWEGKWFNQITAWKVERQALNYANQPQQQSYGSSKHLCIKIGLLHQTLRMAGIHRINQKTIYLFKVKNKAGNNRRSLIVARYFLCFKT